MDEPRGDLKSIFTESLEYPAGPARLAFLDRACGGDATLRARVVALLEAHDEGGRFLDSTPNPAQATLAADFTLVAAPPPPEPGPIAAAPSRSPLAERPGTTIGPYKLLQTIGEGGMGTVFLAEQEKPIRRKVALKVIKPGMDTRQVVARFEAERQALALMDHPNIARVLDAGATATGRPYFVMELVRGVPITEYCDKNHLNPRERLELFLPVCRAIQHAHQKGIIHRDIKPSNVMITLHDGVPEARVIDFGVAKAIEQRLTERTMFTEFGAIIGTLEYMSPEQAEVGALDVDTRSDIYSLGVLLYELLTGSTPLDKAKLRKAAYSEILRRIREEEPSKPSTKLSELKETLPSISAQRRMEPARLSRLMRGDLDWIVMKSLDKDRTRRYETATGFARDIQRYLDGDAVEACPPSATYKLRKLARKHRTALATIGAFVVVLLLATATSAGLAFWANKERLRATHAEADAKAQQARAQEREGIAIDAVKRFGDVVKDNPELKNNPQLEGLRKKLLKEPQEFFRKLLDQLQRDRDTPAESLIRLGTVIFDLGMLSDEIVSKEDALSIFEHSRVLREGLARSDPASQRLRADLAQNYRLLGCEQLQTGRPAESLASLKRARALYEQLVAEHPTAIQHRSALAETTRNIAWWFYSQSRPLEGLPVEEQAQAIYERLIADDPTARRHQSDLVASHTFSSSQIARLVGPAASLALLERARAHYDRLVVGQTPGEFRPLVLIIGAMIGDLHRGARRVDEAMLAYERVRALSERWTRDEPTNDQILFRLLWSHNAIGNLRLDERRPAEAVDWFRKNLPVQERLPAERLGAAMVASELALTWVSLARHEVNGGHLDEARAMLGHALGLLRPALRTHPDHDITRYYLANDLGFSIQLADKLGRAGEADEARRELSQLSVAAPTSLARSTRLAAVLAGIAPRDDAERLDLANLAYEQSKHAGAARLLAAAFASDPRLADDRRTTHAYNAARAAARAGVGRGGDELPPDEAARIGLRRQALGWLRSELAEWAKVLDRGPGATKAMLPSTLIRWKGDGDLTGIRDEADLARLPEPERADFVRLWADVDALLARASLPK